MRILSLAVLLATLLAPAHPAAGVQVAPASDHPLAKPGRLVVFIGVDISGSFMDGVYFDDSIEFLARYIHAHLNGLGGMEIPNALFVGSIGGAKVGEAKTLFPIQTILDSSDERIESRLTGSAPESQPRDRTN